MAFATSGVDVAKNFLSNSAKYGMQAGMAVTMAELGKDMAEGVGQLAGEAHMLVERGDKLGSKNVDRFLGKALFGLTAGLVTGRVAGAVGKPGMSRVVPTADEVAGMTGVTGGVEATTGVNALMSVTRPTTTMLSGTTVSSFGKTVGQGTVNVGPTIEAIQSGRLPMRNIFDNTEGLLPTRPPGYYQEFVQPTPGIKGVGPQRIIRGQNGEFYYTPDHYKTFTPLN